MRIWRSYEGGLNITYSDNTDLFTLQKAGYHIFSSKNALEVVDYLASNFNVKEL